jgi:hypothetical protein
MDDVKRNEPDGFDAFLKSATAVLVGMLCIPKKNLHPGIPGSEISCRSAIEERNGMPDLQQNN